MAKFRLQVKLMRVKYAHIQSINSYRMSTRTNLYLNRFIIIYEHWANITLPQISLDNYTTNTPQIFEGAENLLLEQTLFLVRMAKEWRQSKAASA